MSDVVVIETVPAEIVEVVAAGPQGPVGDVNPQMPIILAATEAARDAALVSELSAAASQSAAATSAANAATSESNAATSAATATAQATASADSATASAGSAAAAQASATNAANSATDAANSATASANSATNSANSATAAQAAQTATESARDTTLATIGTAALKANNLSDLASIPTALVNLGLNNVSNTSDANKPISTATQAALDLKENAANKGVANGYAGLDAAGKVPANQLPSYVDDVLEFANLVAFPATGEAGKIYVALDTNKTYRWSGSAYVYITSGAVDSVAGKTGVVSLVKGDVGLGNVDNTSDANKPVSTATQTALNAKQNAATAVTKDSATGVAYIPEGTSAQRPASPSFGAQRANSTTGAMEWWNGSAWAPMDGGASFRNKIINGNMLIAQRSSGGTAPINQYTPTLDRWIIDPLGGPVTWGHGGSPFTGTSLPLGSLVATAGVGATVVNMRQRIESVNAYMLAQKKVTVSFYVYGYSTTGATCTPSLSYANSSDNFSAMTTIQVGNTVPIINGTFTKYSFTFNALPLSATQGIQLSFDFKGLSQGVVVALGGVQLEEGEYATPFEHRPYGTELALCQRYYETGRLQACGDGVMAYVSQSTAFAVCKRATPTLIVRDAVGTPGTCSVDAANGVPASLSGDARHVTCYVNNSVHAINSFASFNWEASAEL